MSVRNHIGEVVEVAIREGDQRQVFSGKLLSADRVVFSRQVKVVLAGSGGAGAPVTIYISDTPEAFRLIG